MAKKNEETETKIVMSVPQDIIETQVQAAVAGVLAARGPDLIDTLVRELLSEPAKDRYGNAVRGDNKSVKTKFGLILEQSIKKAAEEEAKVWVEEQRGAIKKAVRTYLGRTQKDVIARMADRIVDKLSTPYVHLTMRFGEED